MANSITVTGIDTYVARSHPHSVTRWSVLYKIPTGKKLWYDGSTSNVSYAETISTQSANGYYFPAAGGISTTLPGTTDGQWWGVVDSAIDAEPWLHGDISATVAFSLDTSSVQYSGIPSGFALNQFFETVGPNPYATGTGTNTVYWHVSEPSNQYISDYTVYYSNGTSQTVSTSGTSHAIGSASGFYNGSTPVLITRIVFATSTGYRVRVRFSGDGIANATAKINDVVVSDKIFSGGERVVVKLSAAEPSRIKRASVLVKYRNGSSEGSSTVNLPGTYGSGKTSCTSTRIGTSSYPPAVYTYRDITFTINSIDRSYEFTVPLETLYNLTVVDDSDAYIKNQSGIARQFGFENTSAGTSFVGWLSPQTRSRVAALGDEVAVSFRTGSTDGYIYQVADDVGNVLALNNAKADLVSVPVDFQAGNLTLHIVARRKTLEVTQTWWGPYAEFIGTSGSGGVDKSLIAAKYPGIENCATHGTGSYDYGDRVELYPEPAQDFQFYGMGASSGAFVPRLGITLRAPDPTSAAPFVIDPINSPYTAVMFFGPTRLQLVKSVEGPGSISGGDEFAVPYIKHDHLPVTLTAIAGADGVFSHWEYTYTKRGVNADNEPAILPVIVDAATEDQQPSLTIDPTKILDGIITIKAVFAYRNPGALLHGNSGALLHGASGTLLFQG